MHLIDPRQQARRAFLKRAGHLALAGLATPFGLNLAAIGDAAAFDATDYRALVCVFLYGGNDYANTVVTYDTPSWQAYRAIRASGPGPAGLAIEQAELAATALAPAVPLPGGRQYALHPAMTGLAGLFASGHAAVLLNVGPLIRPTSKAEYFSADRVRYPLPPQLMSHNDQQSVWQSQGAEGSTVGWGGNLGDLAMSSNGTALFTCISASGNAVFLSGDTAQQYQVSTEGAVQVRQVHEGVMGLFSPASAGVLRELITESRTHVLENEYNRVTRRSIEAEAQPTAAPGRDAGDAVPGGQHARRRAEGRRPRHRCAQRARQAPGVRRLARRLRPARQPRGDTAWLLRRVSEAMKRVLRRHRRAGVADKVTTFTASDLAACWKKQRRRHRPRLGQPSLRDGRRRARRLLRHAAAGERGRHRTRPRTSGTSARGG
ncbi:MAG: Tat pathway signal protein [Rubrivivax sp.]